MTDPIGQISPLWALAAPILLAIFAWLAASLNGALQAQAAGRSVLSGAGSPLAEVARLLRQRRRTPVAADLLLFRVGGAGLIVVALLMIVVVPLGRWTLADIAVGVVWFNAMDVMVWALMWLTGWGANSVHSLIGGYRFLAQALSYELPLMFALITPAVAASSLRVADVVAAQQGLWFVVWMPVAFATFAASVIAFSAWGPFGTTAGSDIAGGILAETSGVDRLLILAGRYALLSAGALFSVPLFLGGGAGPLLPAWLWVVIKALVVLALLVLVRHRVPQIRPDRFAALSWLVVLPAVLLQVLVVAVIAVQRSGT